MGISFFDGFDHYGAISNFTRKWTSGAPVSLQTGRFGTGNCIRYTSTATTVRSITDSSTVYIGFAYRITTGAVGSLCSISNAGTVHCGISLTDGGRIFAWRATAATPLGSPTYSSPILFFNNWNYIEVKFVIHDTTGSVEVRLNGNTSPILNLTNVDTRNGTPTTANELRIFGVLSTTIDYDDLYISDSAFLGDVRVQTLLPNATGTNAQLIKTGTGTNNYEVVDETTPDDDTSYVSETSGAAKKDTYNFPATTGTISTVHAVQTNLLAKKTDAGAVQIRPVIITGASNNGTSITPATSYTYNTEIFLQDPNGPTAWTQSSVDSAEFGVEVI